MRPDIEFRSGDERVAAWLYLPDDGADAPRPCVVLAHGFGAPGAVS